MAYSTEEHLAIALRKLGWKSGDGRSLALGEQLRADGLDDVKFAEAMFYGVEGVDYAVYVPDGSEDDDYDLAPDAVSQAGFRPGHRVYHKQAFKTGIIKSINGDMVLAEVHHPAWDETVSWPVRGLRHKPKRAGEED